jgi:phosphoribosylformylglycinamidine synthase
VSFYNETDGESIHPTPIIGMLGVLEDTSKMVDIAFKNEGDVIVLLGETAPELGGSEYAWTIHRHLGGTPPALDIARERALIDTLVSCAERALLAGAHDCSEGGIGVTLAESAIAGGIGARIEPTQDGGTTHVWLFSESASRAVVTCGPDDVTAVLDEAGSRALPAVVIGVVGGDALAIRGALEVPVSDLADRFENGLVEAL